MRTFKNYILPLLIIAGAIFGFLQLRKSEQKDISNLKAIGLKTVGTLYETAGEHLKYRFSVEGEIYFKGQKEPYNYLQDGETYMVYYNPENPDNNYLDFKQPIFDDSFKTVEPVSIEQKVGGSIRFTYKIDEHVITRITWMDNFERTSKLVVAYNPTNPKIGYLVNK